MNHLAIAIALAATLWPVGLTAAFVDHRDGHPSWMSVAAYLAAGRVCHQRPERSFSAGGGQWPVCGRCAGLYLAAALGAWWGVQRRWPSTTNRVRLIAVAAIPSALTVVAEVLFADRVLPWHRFVAALPLGFVLLRSVVHVLVSSSQIDAVD